ncbi:DUF2294 family protein [Priestia filamentosa]|uniref:DUF2294 domain-containing protein n=1 Tax=Priestia filamentosa TaxID=1402861 RepID=UPI001FB281ED|nr:DUF2294 domain-containing protein [Priestia filamentosa]UOE62567.1 DUF2294 family protein [Priestia filamentosa]
MSRALEHEFSSLVRETRKEHVGNGPREITTRFIGTWAISEMKGNLTNVEKFMIKSPEGERMVREARTSLIKKIYENPELVKKFEKLVGAKIVRMFSDINIGEDIAMTIFVFDGNLEEKSR